MSVAATTFHLLAPLLARMDPETAHEVTVALLRATPWLPSEALPALPVTVYGRTFPHPLGLAAGFDKNAQVARQMIRLGFAWAEIGTVTPRPQSGNPRPRLFRLASDAAVINRMGFNNQGAAALERRLAELPSMIGVNIGANRDSEDRIADYAALYRRFAPHAAYIAVNVSSPNTPGLRDLQAIDALNGLLDRLCTLRAQLSRPAPILLKLSPDLAPEELVGIARLCVQKSVDGAILSNTTVSRPQLRSPAAHESGGLSGRPLFALSTRQLARFYIASQGRLPLIGVGGISDADTAWAKIKAGASLLQLYTALVFEGPGVVKSILEGLGERMRAAGYGRLEDAVGCEAERFAADQGLAGT